MKAKKPQSDPQKTKKRHHWWLVLLLLIPAALVLIGLSVISALFLRSTQPLEQQDSPTVIADAGLTATDATPEQTDASNDAPADSTHVDSAEPTADTIKSVTDLPKPINDGNYQPTEVAVEKTIVIDEPIYFTRSTINESNQARGTTKITQAGVNGNRKITYNVKYNSKGQSLAVEKISETVDKEPVPEITKVGTSDYNLNAASTLQYYNSAVCLTTDVDASGCWKNASSYNFARSFELEGRHYIYLIYEINGQRDVTFAPAIIVNNGTFIYSGQNYLYEIRQPGETVILTEKLCANYGLACGRW